MRRLLVSLLIAAPLFALGSTPAAAGGWCRSDGYGYAPFYTYRPYPRTYYGGYGYRPRAYYGGYFYRPRAYWGWRGYGYRRAWGGPRWGWRRGWRRW